MSIVFTAADIDRIADLQPEGWQDIRPFFRDYVARPFCHPIKLEIHDEIAGIGCVILNTETAWLAHIIVAPHSRRHGLGRTITSRLIDVAEARGIHRQLLIATADGQPLYEQLGFSESFRYAFHSEAEFRREGGGNGIRPLTSMDSASLLALDRRATGEDRRGMITACASRGWVVEASGEEGLAGYYLPDLGDGAVVAATAEAGIDLLRLRLAEDPKIVLPTGNRAAMEFLAAAGARVDSTCARMVRGGEDPLDPTMLFQRVGGYFG